MLGQHNKKELLNILRSMITLHHQGIVGSSEQISAVLVTCQQAAISVGEQLEKKLSECEPIISLLRKYCDDLYLFSLNMDQTDKYIMELDQSVYAVEELLHNVPTRYKIVFMPYKASMWDSLESVYLAAQQDKRCECLVVPIPYYEFDSRTSEPRLCYEGGEFPEYIAITDFRQYHIEEELPDAVYIHNPYDNNNLLTSVHPSYYSQELKKYAEKLIYIPYYVTTGLISPEHKNLSVYQHMDYMIAQSETFKNGSAGYYYYDKILPLGSPKLDRVIRICKEYTEVPEEWQPVLSGKKKVMLNTSINCILRDTEAYLKKLKYLFQWIKTVDKVAIIWRPHPLMESTFRSMRPRLLEEYHRLISYFEKEQIGILDQTPDVAKTIAISDAYIGESTSSLVNLFGAAGKPLFILNNYMWRTSTVEERQRIFISDMINIDGTWWILTGNNALFSMKDSWSRIHYMGRVEGQPKWFYAYPFMTVIEKRLFLSPWFATVPVCYDTEKRAFTMLSQAKEEDFLCRKVVAYKKSLFYLPGDNHRILEFDTEFRVWKEHSACIQDMERGVMPPYYEETYEWSAEGKDLWITATYTNRLLQFDMENGRYQIYEIGEKDIAFSGIVINNDEMWLAEVSNGRIGKWNRRTGEYKRYSMPKEYQYWDTGYGRGLAHSALIDMGRWIVTIPGFSNGMVQLDKETGETAMLIPAFWETVLQTANGYDPKECISCNYWKKIDENTLFIQRTYDGRAALVNTETGLYEQFYPSMTEESYHKLTDGEDGFEKAGSTGEFSRKESLYFSLEGFIDDLVHDRLEDVKVRQLKELLNLAVNLDGTCGKKVHQFIMSVLSE